MLTDVYFGEVKQSNIDSITREKDKQFIDTIRHNLSETLRRDNEVYKILGEISEETVNIQGREVQTIDKYGNNSDVLVVDISLHNIRAIIDLSEMIPKKHRNIYINYIIHTNRPITDSELDDLSDKYDIKIKPIQNPSGKRIDFYECVSLSTYTCCEVDDNYNIFVEKQRRFSEQYSAVKIARYLRTIHENYITGHKCKRSIRNTSNSRNGVNKQIKYDSPFSNTIEKIKKMSGIHTYNVACNGNIYDNKSKRYKYRDNIVDYFALSEIIKNPSMFNIAGLASSIIPIIDDKWGFEWKNDRGYGGKHTETTSRYDRASFYDCIIDKVCELEIVENNMTTAKNSKERSKFKASAERLVEFIQDRENDNTKYVTIIHGYDIDNNKIKLGKDTVITHDNKEIEHKYNYTVTEAFDTTLYDEAYNKIIKFDNTIYSYFKNGTKSTTETADSTMSANFIHTILDDLPFFLDRIIRFGKGKEFKDTAAKLQKYYTYNLVNNYTPAVESGIDDILKNIAKVTDKMYSVMTVDGEYSYHYISQICHSSKAVKYLRYIKETNEKISQILGENGEVDNRKNTGKSMGKSMGKDENTELQNKLNETLHNLCRNRLNVLYNLEIIDDEDLKNLQTIGYKAKNSNNTKIIKTAPDFNIDLDSGSVLITNLLKYIGIDGIIGGTLKSMSETWQHYVYKTVGIKGKSNSRSVRGRFLEKRNTNIVEMKLSELSKQYEQLQYKTIYTGIIKCLEDAAEALKKEQHSNNNIQ